MSAHRAPSPAPKENPTAADQSTRNLLNAPLSQSTTSHTHGGAGQGCSLQPCFLCQAGVTSKRTPQSQAGGRGKGTWREEQDSLRVEASGWKSQILSMKGAGCVEQTGP